MNIEVFRKVPVMGILRGISEEVIDPLVETVIFAGLKTIEITMNTNNAESLITKMVKSSNQRLMIGAGTVMSIEAMHKALDAGATFIVSPVLIPDVTEYCAKNSIPVFPGAFTPLEVSNAWNAGATMVKLFPANYLGAAYIKDLKAPLGNVEILACGGVNEENVKTYIQNGASAVAFGSSIFKKEWLYPDKMNEIGKNIKKLIYSIHNQEEL